MIGESFGNYRALSQLGAGGMGAVYLAEHEGLGKRVAIKILLPRYSQDPEMVQRFFNEARAASMIKHPGIVDIYDFGMHTNGAAYIVMELLSGESLGSRMARGGLDEVEIIELTRQLGLALAAAHSHGIVHRDLKPDNLFLSPDPLVPGGQRLKILDFGISKLGEQAETRNVQTVTGQLMGTPLYMSPEQCRSAKSVDARSDLYSIGCILFQLASGRPPFLGEGLGELIVAHMTEQWPTLSEVAPVSPKLSAIVDRLLAKKPEYRYQTAHELVADLDPSAPIPTSTDPARLVPVVTTTPVAAMSTLRSTSGEVANPTKRSSRLGIVIGGGLLVLGAGAWFGLRTAAPPLAATPVAVALPSTPTAPVVPAAVDMSPEPAATSPAVASPSEKRRPKPTRAAPTTTSKTTTPPPSSTPPTPPSQPIKNSVLDPFGN